MWLSIFVQAWKDMANNKVKFEQDLTLLVSRLNENMDLEDARKLRKLKEDLLQLQRANVVKINHSVMEMVCAKFLVQKGYDVQIEHPLNEILTCDLYAMKGYGNLVVEIETGFIPPEHAMDPLTYTSARLASKIIRYSSFACKFAIGVPPHYVLPVPSILALPPKSRTPEDVVRIKKLCDLYYQNPPVTEDDIRNARIHEIYIIDVDRMHVQAMDPEKYIKRVLRKGVFFTKEDDATLERPKTGKSPCQKPDKWAT
jgi:hypothetical protein